jgi:hypothetical protein
MGDTMANKVRGEVKTEMAGEVFVFLATLNALAEIEDVTGKPFPVLAVEMSNSEISVKMLLACAVAFARAGGADDEKLAKIGNAQGSIPDLAGAVAACISAAFASEKPAKN